MEPPPPPNASGGFLPPTNPMVSTFYEVSQRGHAEIVLAVWSCGHKLLSCNARFTAVFERNPTSLTRLSWPDLCGPTRTLPDKELAGYIDESHEKLKLIHLSLRDGLTNACTVRVTLLSARYRAVGLLLTCATLPALDGPPDILWSGRSILKGAPFQETDLKDLRSRLEQPQSQLVLVSPRRRISNVPHPEHLNQFTFKHQALPSSPMEPDVVLGAQRALRHSVPSPTVPSPPIRPPMMPSPHEARRPAEYTLQAAVAKRRRVPRDGPGELEVLASMLGDEYWTPDIGQ